MTILNSNHTPPTNYQLPKLPSLFQEIGDDWSLSSRLYFGERGRKTDISGYDYEKMSTAKDLLLLPPILTNHHSQASITSSSPPPLSPSYSTCSSPNSSSVSSFTSGSNKKGSIQSLLNSGSELLQLERYAPEEDIVLPRKRALHHTEQQRQQSKKRQKLPIDTRQIKGLRLFSKQVCDKVAEKKTTTYNEVADELATDIQKSQQGDIVVDGKNIRRRVYDALNVLMALNIIAKDRKEIKWVGSKENSFSTIEQEIQLEETRQENLLNSIQNSKSLYQDQINHLNRLRYLVKRNYHQQTGNQFYLPLMVIESSTVDFNHGHEACLSLSTSSNIYQDADILANLWPQSTSPTVTTVSS